MCLKTEYFLKNYLLNFKFKKGRYPVYSAEQTRVNYRLIINSGNKCITFNIAKTNKLNIPQKYVLVNTHYENMHTILCYYEPRVIESDFTLFKVLKDFNQVTYSTNDKGDIEVTIGVNLIDEVFHHLSAVEEYKKESSGQKIQPYYFENESKTVNEPLVDDFYNLFTGIVNAVLKEFNIHERMQRKLEGFNVSLTHDVDAIKKNYFTSIRYLCFLFATFVRKRDGNILKKVYRFLSHNSDFNQLINIVHMEESFGFKSTFYFYSKVAKNGILSKLINRFINPSYNIRSSSVITNIQNVFHKAGFEVGLHGSFSAARDFKSLEEELNLLKKVSHNMVITNRIHFLNFSLIHTPLILEKAGIKCDTTFYYNNTCGFMRHKTCSPFYFYSHLHNRIVDVVEIPTVIMDSTLFNYLNFTAENAYNESIEILDKIRKRNGVACINWHNETSAPEYGWYSTYKDVLEWISDNNANTYTTKEIYNTLVSEGYDGTTINRG